MKRRLGLAELLVKHPKIAILDEPTQGLDPQSISGFLATIRSLRDSEGMTFLLSSHQLNEVQSVCDKVGLFSKGKLISSGTVDELSKKYFGSNLLINVQVEGKSNLFKTFASLGGIVHVERKGDSLWLLECLEDVRAQIAETVFASKEKLVSLELLTHSLNDIYQQAFQEVSREKA
jgi:ABC-2 type transport system ATP-binding protein